MNGNQLAMIRCAVRFAVSRQLMTVKDEEDILSFLDRGACSCGPNEACNNCPPKPDIKPDIDTYLDRAEQTGALTVTIAELREFLATDKADKKPDIGSADFRDPVETMRRACIEAVNAEKRYEASDFPVCHSIVRAIEAIPSPPQPVDETERLREAVQEGIDQLHWINAQAENAMATSAGAATANGDSDGALQMLNSISSDIGINAMMLRDNLSAALQHKEEVSRG